MLFGCSNCALKARKDIARVFYCTKIGKRIVMLHLFVKKSQKTPRRELKLALKRMDEVLNES